MLVFFFIGPVDYEPVQVETAEGVPITDWSSKPPNIVYVVGKKL